MKNTVEKNALLALALVAGSCSSGRSSSAEAEGFVTPDTVAPHTETLSMLPDTVYKSAERVHATVTTVMSDTDSTICTLTNAYATAPGVLTFRGGPRRDARFGGCVDGRPDTLEIEWTFHTETDMRETGGFGQWGGGSGWTGQPLYVEWPDSLLERFRAEGVVTPDFGKREIMVGSLASHVYFINYDTGKASRQPVFVDNPVKGTISLDPTLSGSLYVGLGVPAVQPVGARVIDLHEGKVTQVIPNDPRAWRGWQAADSSPLRVGQFVFHPSENGTLYKYVTPEPGKLELHSAMRYRVNGAAPGIESSMSVYRNYGYVCDNHGNVICINLNTLRPVWHAALGDDIDATPALAEEGGTPFIYVGCEVDRSGRGFSEFMKLNGLTGDTVWHRRIDGQRFELNGKHFDGGYYASPLIGTGNCSGLVFDNVVLNTRGQNGALVALDRETGAERYRTPLRAYAWSSPVGFTNEDDEMFIVTGDCIGNLYLIDGLTGEIICRRPVGANFESSPVVIGNTLVVGSRGNSIYKVRVI